MNEYKNSEVLAKSEPQVTVVQHIRDCLLLLEQLRYCTPNLPIAGKEWFWQLAKASLVVHDLGKAHPEFQRLLRKIRNTWHFQRHELFSLFFVEWLELPERDKNYIRYAVAGHHKELDDLCSFVRNNYKTCNKNQVGCSLIGDEKTDFGEECGKINPVVAREILAFFNQPFRESATDIDILAVIDKLSRENPVLEESGFKESLLLAGVLKQCDHMASAGVEHLQHIRQEDFSFLYHNAILYTHQQQAAEAAGNVILSAPTGAGKTEAALLWLKKQMEEKGQGRVFYVLPFTASINAMYERLDRNFGTGAHKVGMVHGKLSQYIEFRMSENSQAIGEKERKRMIGDFRSLVTPVKVVTPFQLLKHLFGLKGFEKGMFEWAGCYLIFDEIHAYEPEVFAQIIVLLKFMTREMGARAHIMTATMPGFIRKELEKAVGDFVTIRATPELYERFNRHKVTLKAGKLMESITGIQERLDGGSRVLVVCNTVAEAQQAYDALECGRKVLLHGAFNGEDRFAKECMLQDTNVRLLVGTQAIEVSLDIDFDCIYTEPAPLDALIQRFGRVNRKREKGICDCFVFRGRNEGDKYIYRDEEVVNRTLEVLGKIEAENGGMIRESILQEAIDNVYPDWEEEDRENYGRVLNFLEYSVTKELSPLKYSAEKEEAFNKQFNGIQVLPVSLCGRYREFLSAGQFVKAESLLVNLNKKRFAGLSRQQAVHKERFVFESPETGAIYNQSTFVIQRKYNPERGLLLNEKEEESYDDICL